MSAPGPADSAPQPPVRIHFQPEDLLVEAPWGEVIGRLDHDAPGVLFAERDLAEVDRARAAIPALANDRPFAPPAVGGLAVRGAAE